MNLENTIKDCISEELKKGIIEKVISQKLEECIADSVKDLFSYRGAVKQAIETKIKETIVPYLEGYDYSKYITKVDYILTEVLKSATLENRKLLDNFKTLIEPYEKLDTIKLSAIYEKWQEYVADNASTYNLEVICEEGVRYSPVEVELNVEEDSSRDWSNYERHTVFFECEHDKDMNYEIKLKRWKKGETRTTFDIDNESITDINSLRRLNSFDIFMLRLVEDMTKVEIDTQNETDDVELNAEPEASFS